jgi:antitoxin YefM
MVEVIIMDTINVTSARRELYKLVRTVNTDSRPIHIHGKDGNAVLVSESDWKALQETLYINSVPGLAKSLLESLDEPLESMKKYDPEEEW